MLRLQHGILIVIPRRSKAPTWESQPLIYRLNKDIRKIGGDCHRAKALRNDLFINILAMTLEKIGGDCHGSKRSLAMTVLKNV